MVRSFSSQHGKGFLDASLLAQEATTDSGAVIRFCTEDGFHLVPLALSSTSGPCLFGASIRVLSAASRCATVEGEQHRGIKWSLPLDHRSR